MIQFCVRCRYMQKLNNAWVTVTANENSWKYYYQAKFLLNFLVHVHNISLYLSIALFLK